MNSRDPISLDTAERMLSFVRGVDDRDVWVKMAYILKEEFGEAAFIVWDQWSQGAANYVARDARDVWKSCRPSSGSARVTVGTLIALAKEGGWRPTDLDRKPVDPEKVRQREEERRARLDAERIQAQAEREECAAQAADMWARALEPEAHPYLERKRIEAFGARVLDGELIIPLRHGPGALVGLQRIRADGTKLFLKGTPAGGAYTVIGKPSRTGTVAIAEGFATAASIHMATGYCVVVALNAGNLVPVAKKIRAAMPNATLVLAADDDAFTDGNPGVTAAQAAAREVGGTVAVPIWLDERGTGTDFNDLHLVEGLDAVRMCFENPLDPGDNRGTVKAASDRVPAEANNPASRADIGSPSGSGASVPVTRAPGGSGPSSGAARDVVAPGDLPLPDYVSWLPNYNDKGKPLSTIENLDEVCRRLNLTVRYNVISKEEEILIPGASFSIDNRQNASLAWLISECAKFRMPVDRVPDFVTYLCDQNPYNPVADWITSRPWDGQDRLTALVGTVHATGEVAFPKVAEMKRALITRWMISAVAAAFNPTGVSAHGVLVFQGDQYIGKTKWFKTLVPAHLGVLQDGVILRPEDRDSVKQCVSNWLVELGELDATFRKSDIAALKAFLTKDRDILRRAYARKESEFARRTVFFASVNPREFLHDPTGNRRYWTIECESLDHDHGIDMQQCWAQVYEQLYRPGESWFLTPEEMDMLNDHNKLFEVIDPIEELIANGLDWDSDVYYWTWTSASEVLRALGRDTPTQAEATRAAHVIRARNGKRSRKQSGNRALLVPQVKNR